ncbi:hypothetical protein F4780DRAFT_790370 [Xylariomycetidae sp. FL0641]|nr:hypothetical protein F4780DRAFT_790370 [Xylariomycetidae sp. FL0641]
MASAMPPIALHGGPGAGHDYRVPLTDLTSRQGVPVIFYDQIGCDEVSDHCVEPRFRSTTPEIKRVACERSSHMPHRDFHHAILNYLARTQ